MVPGRDPDPVLPDNLVRPPISGPQPDHLPLLVDQSQLNDLRLHDGEMG